MSSSTSFGLSAMWCPCFDFALHGNVRLSFGDGERLHIATFAIVRLASRPALIQFLTLDSLTENPGTCRFVTSIAA